MSNVIEEAILTEDVKNMLDEAIAKYYICNANYKALESTKNLYNKMIKDIFTDNNITKYVASDGTKASISTTNKPVFNEDKLIEYLKTKNIEGIVKTKEYVDMEALECAIYHGQVNASELQSFKEDRITTTLRCTRPKQLNEG